MLKSHTLLKYTLRFKLLKQYRNDGDDYRHTGTVRKQKIPPSHSHRCAYIQEKKQTPRITAIKEGNKQTNKQENSASFAHFLIYLFIFCAFSPVRFRQLAPGLKPLHMHFPCYRHQKIKKGCTLKGARLFSGSDEALKNK